MITQLQEQIEMLGFKLKDAEETSQVLINIEIGNRDRFRSLIAQYDQSIKDLREKMTRTKAEHDFIIEARKNEIDHLARQCVHQNEENAVLKTDNCHLKEANEQLKVHEAALLNDNHKYVEQNVRLAEEKRKLSEEVAFYICTGSKTDNDKLRCGICVSCNLHYSIVRLLEGVRKLKTWPWYRRGKQKYCIQLQKTVNGIQDQINDVKTKKT